MGILRIAVKTGLDFASAADHTGDTLHDLGLPTERKREPLGHHAGIFVALHTESVLCDDLCQFIICLALTVSASLFPLRFDVNSARHFRETNETQRRTNICRILRISN